MHARFVKLRERIRTSLWVIPAVCTIAAGVLALVLVDVDSHIGSMALAVPWIFQGSAESARSVLSTIAGSMITVASTVYSITFVVLVLASVQFAPRVMRSFMRDRSNQVVLGFFVATFTYCLVVLRAVRNNGTVEFVPYLAVTVGLLLALVSLGMLIYFIDHLSHGIRVSSLLDTIVRETLVQIDHLYPRAWHTDLPSARPPPVLPPGLAWRPVLAADSGYLQYADHLALLHLAVGAAGLVREEHHVGDFVMVGTPVAWIATAGEIRREWITAINDAFALGSSPTLQQDIAYGLRQIVDIALKAISPAVNDPTTAINCIDQLGVVLLTLAGREMPHQDLSDATGTVRVFVRERTFADLVRLAFTQILHYGAGDPMIVVRILRVLTQVATSSPSAACRRTLEAQLEHVAAAAQGRVGDAYELEVVLRHVEDARQMIAAGHGGT